MDTDTKKICPRCNYSGRGGDASCPYCGVKLISECPTCGAPIRVVFAKFCYGCGTPLDVVASGNSAGGGTDTERSDGA